MIPWLLELAEKTLNKEDSWENTVLQAAHLLWQMYDCLSQNSFCQATFKELTRKFLLLYLALEQSSPEGLWKFTPKFHLLQELAEFDQVLPSLSWTYRDEDWGDLWQLPLEVYVPVCACHCVITSNAVL